MRLDPFEPRLQHFAGTTLEGTMSTRTAVRYTGTPASVIRQVNTYCIDFPAEKYETAVTQVLNESGGDLCRPGEGKRQCVLRLLVDRPDATITVTIGRNCDE